MKTVSLNALILNSCLLTTALELLFLPSETLKQVTLELLEASCRRACPPSLYKTLHCDPQRPLQSLCGCAGHLWERTGRHLRAGPGASGERGARMGGAAPPPRPTRSNPRLSRRPDRDAAAAAAPPAAGPSARVLGECDPSSRPQPCRGSSRVGAPYGWSQWPWRRPQEKATVWMVGREENPRPERLQRRVGPCNLWCPELPVGL